MSVKTMGFVWDLQLPPTEKLILLAYADKADHDGTRIYPSVKHVAERAGVSERTVQRVTKSLIDRGIMELVEAGTGRANTNEYRILMERVTPVTVKGDILTPFENDDELKGDIQDAEPPERVTPVTEKGDIAMSPEPSLIFKAKQPSKKQSSNVPPPRSKRARLLPRQEEEVKLFPDQLEDALRAANVFPDLWLEVAISNRPFDELSALVAWSQDSPTQTPGALFMSRLRSGARPPAEYFQPACPGCGGRGEHEAGCTAKYVNGEFSHAINRS